MAMMSATAGSSQYQPPVARMIRHGHPGGVQPSPVRPDREPVKVTPPAVPARDDGTDQLTVMIGENHGVRITANQRGHSLASIRRAAVILGCLLPHCEQPIYVSHRGAA